MITTHSHIIRQGRNEFASFTRQTRDELRQSVLGVVAYSLDTGVTLAELTTAFPNESRGALFGQLMKLESDGLIRENGKGRYEVNSI